MTNKSFYNSKAAAVLAVGIVGGVGVWYVKKQAKEAIDIVGDAINPISETNIFNRGVNSVVQTLTGKENQTLGGWIYDVTH
jgi:hypothetical protein